ncbi:ABC transporter substrate-binding protein [Plantibacter flavus]|uniref:ABC transporter substrate-binding protein n=1 Tax=Plantibacter TaxID=190323 RepID=UPI0008DCC92C|nr:MULTISPECIES: extracellular solute-binding protein [Plantibacter]AQX79048.1 ABC transporter substrate-binding protein [Plantibacter flavus]OII39307.1 ABC transporter substrate-binding protein [Plantibacter sp. MMLR14_011]CAH0229299.1 Multiple sugar-binding protein [Plantibacter cousiniae]
MTRPMRRKAVLAPLAASAGALALVLTGCGGGGGSTTATSFTYLINSENTMIPGQITALSENQCKAENTALPLKVETVPQTNLDQKLQLLAGQNSLPVMYAAGNAPDLTKTLDGSGNVVDFEQALTDLDALDDIEPAAISTIKALYGGKFNVLPYQYNIEGIWYNKQIFADAGVEIPQTWDELVTAADTISKTGVTPFSASGEQGWPLTRLVGDYLFRDLGADALQKVADGDAKLTDPEYVEAAAAVADLGAKGYFGQGVGSIDYDTAAQQFLTGKAAMFYMGSWILESMNDETANQIGIDNVGFMPFPAVEGGKGSIDEYPANVGLPTTMNAKLYDDKVGDWLGCIAENYGSAALQDQGTISGFKTNTEVTGVAPLTQEIQTTISESTSSVLWFEALFSTKATTTSQTNAAQLVTGAISPEEFMQLVQADLDN